MARLHCCRCGCKLVVIRHGDSTDLTGSGQGQQLRVRETMLAETPLGIDDILLPASRTGQNPTQLSDAAVFSRPRSSWFSSVSFKSNVQQEEAYGHGFLLVPVFLVTGASLWFSLAVSPSPYIVLAAFVFCTSLAICLRYRVGLGALLLKTTALLLAGMLLASVETMRIDTIMLDTAVTTRINGKVERRELDARGYWRYTVKLTATSEPVLSRAPEKVTVLSRSRHEDIAVGAMLSGRARLSPPSGPALPRLNDFAFSSYFDGIGATGFFYGAPSLVTSAADADAGADTEQDWLTIADTWLYHLRSAIANRIRTVIGGDAGAFAASIVTDERRAISAETMEALRVSGLAHIVAISGLNMALASGIFFVGLRMALSLFPGFAQRWPVKKIAAFAALMMTLAYYLISGFAVSAERAWLMMSIMLIAVLLDRPSISLRNVAISAIIIVAVSPSEVMGPSFQMSFAATVALVSAYAFWARREVVNERLIMAKRPMWLTSVSIFWTFCVGIIVTSLIGGISTAIYSIEHFHRVTTYGLAANLAAMPVMSFIVMPFALIGMLLMPFGLDAPFLTVMGYGMAMVIQIATQVADWGGDAGIGRQHGWFMVVATLGFLILTLFRTRLAWFGLPALAIAVGLLVFERTKDMPDVVVYEDGQLVALTGSDTVSTTRTKPSDFIFDQWKRALLLPDIHQGPVILQAAAKQVPAIDNEQAATSETRPSRRTPMSDVEKAEHGRHMREALTQPPGRFICIKDSWCIARALKGVSIAVISESALVGTACDIADIVVTSRRVGFDACHSGAVLLSNETLRRTGSLEITLGNAANTPIQAIEAAMAAKQRPWTQHRGYDWRSRSFDQDLPQHVKDLLAATDQ